MESTRQSYSRTGSESTGRISMADAQMVYQLDQIGGAKAEIVRFTINLPLPDAKGMLFGPWLDLVRQTVQVYE